MEYIAVIASINGNDISQEVNSFKSAMKRYNIIDSDKKAIVKIIFTMDPNTYLGTSEVHFLYGNKDYIESLGIDFNNKSYGTISKYMI